MKHDKQGDSEHSPGPLSDHSDADDTTYQPVSKEEISLDDNTFIIPEKHLQQARLQETYRHREELEEAEATA